MSNVDLTWWFVICWLDAWRLQPVKIIKTLTSSFTILKINTIVPIEDLLVVKLLDAKIFESGEVNMNPGRVFRFKVGYVSQMYVVHRQEIVITSLNESIF